MNIKNRVKSFSNFEKLNEQSEEVAFKPKGYNSETMIARIEQLMEIMPDRAKFGVPADNKGYSLSYRDANGAIQKIQDIDHYYSGKGESVTFYCWNISYSGSWDATKSLRTKIDEFGGFGREQNMNLKKVIKYFTENPEDVDNIRSISLALDSKTIRKDKAKTSDQVDDNYPQPDSNKDEHSESNEPSEESKE